MVSCILPPFEIQKLLTRIKLFTSNMTRLTRETIVTIQMDKKKDEQEHEQITEQKDVLYLKFRYIDGDEETIGKPRTPVKGTEGAAGYDLFASKAVTVPSKGKALVSTGLSFEIPRGTYGRIGRIEVNSSSAVRSGGQALYRCRCWSHRFRL
jgi:hypothetical protein